MIFLSYSCFFSGEKADVFRVLLVSACGAGRLKTRTEVYYAVINPLIILADLCNEFPLEGIPLVRICGTGTFPDLTDYDNLTCCRRHCTDPVFGNLPA